MNTVKLRDIATIYSGNSINKSEKQKKYMRDVPGWNYIATKDVDFDGTVTYKNGVVIPFTETKFKTAPAGTVFVCSEGGSAGKKTALITEEVCFGNKLFALVNDKGLFNPKYLFYYTRYEGFLKQFKVLATSLMGGISLKNFGNIEVPMPNLEVQSKMVGLIDEQLSSLDNAVETLNKTKEQLGVYRQAVLREAFAQSDSLDIVELQNIVADIRIGPFGTMLHKSDYVEDGIPIINPQHIKNQAIIPSKCVSISLEKAEELRSYRLKKNDVIMGRRGEMGRTAAVGIDEEDWICGTGSIIIRLKPEYDAVFFSQILASPDIVHYLEEKSTGTTMNNLNEDIVKHIPVPNITAEEQKKIQVTLDAKVSVCENIEQTVDTALAQAEAMRQSILKEAFEGRLA